jgi:hypothetical protein
MAKRISKSPQQGINTSFIWLMPFCITVYGLLYFNFGEIIAVNEGCGWDGNWYADVAAYGVPQITSKQFTPYRAQRWLPSIIVHFTAINGFPLLKNFGIPMPKTVTDAVVTTFRIYNLFLLIGAAWLWGLISRHLSLKTFVAWIGFSLMFGSFAVLKYSFYYPPLTDTSAFFIGILMLYAYLLRREWLLLLSIVLGFWTWQTTFFVGIILYLFPSPTSNEANPKSTMETATRFVPIPHSFRIILTSVYAVVLVVGIWLSTDVYRIGFDITERPFVPLVYVCAVLVVVYGSYILFFCLQTVSPRSFLSSFQGKVRYRRFAIALLVTIVLYSLKTIIQNSELRSEMPLSLFLGGTFTLSVAKPLLAVVANTVFYGLLLLMVILLLPRLVPYVRSLGIGFSLVFTVTLLLSGLMTESRQLANLMPFLVVPCCLLLSSVQVHKVALAGIVILMVLWSQAWVSINFPEMNTLATTNHITEPAMQVYFRFHGPWMGMEAYMWSAFAVIGSAGIILWLLRPVVRFTRADFQ